MNMKIVFATVLVVFAGLATGLQVQFHDCGSKSGKPTGVFVDPCKVQPCTLHRGGNSTISVSFIPNEVVKSVKSSVHGIIYGVPVPFPITGTDGCVNCGLTCPLKSGVEVKFFKSIPVLKAYPSMKLSVRWELIDGSGNDIVCVEILAKLA